MLRFLLVLFVIIAGCSAYAQPQKSNIKNSYMKMVTVTGKFEDVREDLEFAITGRGIVINNVSHIGSMLKRTGKDLGAKKVIYGKAEALEFCSATVSRNTMEADPHNIVFCPYIIAVYTLPAEEGKVYLSYRRPQLVGTKASKESLKAVENLLDSIISEVVN